MTVAACGHTIDVWYTTTNVICKPCFEQQGFVYNRNSYHGIDERLVARVDVAPSAAERERLRARARRVAA